MQTWNSVRNRHIWWGLGLPYNGQPSWQITPILRPAASLILRGVTFVPLLPVGIQSVEKYSGKANTPEANFAGDAVNWHIHSFFHTLTLLGFPNGQQVIWQRRGIMTPDEFIQEYETSNRTHGLEHTLSLIDKNAIYWFSDGTCHIGKRGKHSLGC